MYKNLTTVLALVSLLLVTGCKSFEKLSTTISKTDDKAVVTTTDSKHGDYLGESYGANASTDKQQANSITNFNSVKPINDNSVSNGNMALDSGMSYRKDYSSLSGSTASAQVTMPLSREEMTLRDYNQNLVTQYQRMDELGEVILFEVGVIEKSWQLYAEQYKTASASERDHIARELTRLDDNKLLLYKAYTKIYKQGKLDWLNIKKEVENTILSTRGVK